MCLGVPGKVVEIYEANGTRMGKVDFSGIKKEVCLAYLPEIAGGRLHHRARRVCHYPAGRKIGAGDAGHVPRSRHAGGGAAGRRAGDSPVKYLDEFRDPELAQKLLDEIRQITTPPLGDDGGVRRADAFDHPQRHRPAAAAEIELIHGPGCPVCVTPLERDRQGAGNCGPRRRHLLLVWRHAARAGQRQGPVPRQERRR
jgi:hypothetical protein